MTLKYNELQDLVLPKVSIDEFSPKTGDNNDVIVLGFYVKDKHMPLFIIKNLFLRYLPNR